MPTGKAYAYPDTEGLGNGGKGDTRIRVPAAPGPAQSRRDSRGAGPATAAAKSPYPAKRNPDFTLDRPITEERAATGYNNFYEFHPTDKQAVKNRVGKFVTGPWMV
jgi:hypothetical protein